MNLLSDKDNEALHRRYSDDDLYRYWADTLCLLERSYGTMDQVDIWFQTEEVTAALRQSNHPESEIPRIYNKMLKQTSKVNALTIMTVLVTRLANAAEKGHEDDRIPNDYIAEEIAEMLLNEAFFVWLIDFFRERKTDIDGNKIHIDRSDPMKASSNGNLAPSTEARNESLYKMVIEKTSVLKTTMGDDWTKWERLWQEIVKDQTLADLLAKPAPRGKPWGEINAKMIGNVLGCFNDAILKKTVSQLSTLLSVNSNIKTYILQHRPSNNPNGNSSCVLSTSQYQKIKGWLAQHLGEVPHG